MADHSFDREEIAHVISHHVRLNAPAGKCSCGHEVPLGRSFSLHVADAILANNSGSSGPQSTSLQEDKP